ncbi:hypothetical protein V1T76_02240 [Roseibium sp. FZY0029]|uniref:hypothetical protein n=1 Tax=Roseibium sp. FZY0029 TaxID=3116647 RepID=UPI002EAD28D6|nr:hypothetical protein [Roseibium sp. FZY0029]
MLLGLLPRFSRATSSYPYSIRAILYGVVGPDGASVHFIPEKIWIFSGFDSLKFVNQNLDGAGINSPYGKVK